MEIIRVNRPTTYNKDKLAEEITAAGFNLDMLCHDPAGGYIDICVSENWTTEERPTKTTQLETLADQHTGAKTAAQTLAETKQIAKEAVLDRLATPSVPGKVWTSDPNIPHKGDWLAPQDMNVVVTDDPRLSDTRVPTAHVHPYSSDTHNHNADYEAKNVDIQTHVASAHAPSTAQPNADITKAEIEAKLTGAIASHSHAGSGPSYALLANGATAMQLATTNTVKVTPTAAATYTTTVPPAGTECHIMIVTTGTVSRTITFGTGFRSTATLLTGTVAARMFVVSFVSDGVNMCESGRTPAMVA